MFSRSLHQSESDTSDDYYHGISGDHRAVIDNFDYSIIESKANGESEEQLDDEFTLYHNGSVFHNNGLLWSCRGIEKFFIQNLVRISLY